MTIIDDIQAALWQSGIDPGTESGMALRRGWDYWLPGIPASDGRGIARTAHALSEIGALPDKALPILDPAMPSVTLLGGIWRQILIRPGDPLASGLDAFAVSELHAACSRDDHLVALVGHTPRDLVLWLDHLRRTDLGSFERLLRKDFRGAVSQRDDIVSAPWPDSVRRHWKKGEGDYLPPFLVAVLYAELARLAMNQAGLLELAFDEGVELTTTQFLDRVPMAGMGSSPLAIRRRIEMAPFQSVALGAPGAIYATLDRDAAKAWARTAAGRLALATGMRGGMDILPHGVPTALKLRDGFAAAPNFWVEEREDKGWSRQPRPATTFWGLNWRRHAAVGLVEIATAARDWNAAFRTDGPQLGRRGRLRLARAMIAITVGWVAEFHPAAGLTAMAGMAPKDELKQVEGSPLTVDLYLGERSGQTLLEQAESELVKRPPKGVFGYTARYMPHLWLDDDGDDIGHYRRLQMRALSEHAAALDGKLPSDLRDSGRIPPEVVAMLGREHGITSQRGKIGHNRPRPEMTSDPAAAIAAQRFGQMISPLSTDCMLELLLRQT